MPHARAVLVSFFGFIITVEPNIHGHTRADGQGASRQPR